MPADHRSARHLPDDLRGPELVIGVADAEVTADGVGLDPVLFPFDDLPQGFRIEGFPLLPPHVMAAPDQHGILPQGVRKIIGTVTDEDA